MVSPGTARSNGSDFLMATWLLCHAFTYCPINISATPSRKLPQIHSLVLGEPEVLRHVPESGPDRDPLPWPSWRIRADAARKRLQRPPCMNTTASGESASWCHKIGNLLEPDVPGPNRIGSHFYATEPSLRNETKANFTNG
jgi:hypothetical protein